MDLSPQDAMAKYNIPLETTAMDKGQFSEAPYILIRHGLSNFNYRALVAQTDFGKDSEEFKAVETDPNGIDPELHPIGILQCENG